MSAPEEYELPYFGSVDPNDLDHGYYENIEYDGREIQLDMSFEDIEAGAQKLDVVKAFLERLPQQDQKNRTYIQQDYLSGMEEDSVNFYLNFHLEEIGEEQLRQLLGIEGEGELDEEQLLDKLKLVRVGLYPDDEAGFAICDYSFGRDLTNYILVISVDENGELLHMAVES